MTHRSRRDFSRMFALFGAVLGAATITAACSDDSGGDGSGKSTKGAVGAECLVPEDCEDGLDCSQPDGVTGKQTCITPAADGGGSSSGGDVAPIDTYKPPVDEEFWVLYGRRLRQGLTAKPGEGENDIVLTNRKNPKALTNSSTYGLGVNPWNAEEAAIELTKHSFKKAGNLTCNFGCIISPDMKHVAIAKSNPGAKGYTYVLGTMNDNLEIFVGKFGQIKDVADLHFANGYLFYSTARNCFDTGKCQYKIMRRALGGGEAEKQLTVMAPDSDPDVQSNPKHTTYTGRFSVSDDGSTLTFLTTTIRSVKVYAWRGGNVHKLDYICEHPLDNETCVGTGSQYHDNDEVAISPDGSEAILFTIVDRHLRVRRYKVKGEQAPTFSNIVTVPAGQPYLKSVCLNLKDWQHAEVRARPRYSSDGKEIFFLGHSDCSGSSEKKWTDIMSLKIDRIGGKLKQSDFTNYTNNPRLNTPENLWIRDFTLSPDRHYFVFNAAPRYSSSGDPISPTDKRQIKDTEIYTMAAKPGEKAVMITNKARYATDSPVAVVPTKKPK